MNRNQGGDLCAEIAIQQFNTNSTRSKRSKRLFPVVVKNLRSCVDYGGFTAVVVVFSSNGCSVESLKHGTAE